MSALVVLLTTVMLVLLRVPQIFLAPFIDCLVRLLDAWPLAPMDHLAPLLMETILNQIKYNTDCS